MSSVGILAYSQPIPSSPGRIFRPSSSLAIPVRPSTSSPRHMSAPRRGGRGILLEGNHPRNTPEFKSIGTPMDMDTHNIAAILSPHGKKSPIFSTPQFFSTL
jgi:hypothetical protein